MNSHWIVIAGVSLAAVLFLGDEIRAAVPDGLREPLCLTGGTLLSVSSLIYVLCPKPPFAIGAAAWTRSIGAAVLVGFLLFVLFLQGVECELRSTGRGIRTDCKQVDLRQRR